MPGNFHGVGLSVPLEPECFHGRNAVRSKESVEERQTTVWQIEDWEKG